jgi:hypothetical protein
MVEEKEWKEFRESGLLWWINMILHTFGWSIVYQFNDDGQITRVYPARVKFRGFNESGNTDGYRKVSAYMADNANQLHSESLE